MAAKKSLTYMISPFLLLLFLIAFALNYTTRFEILCDKFDYKISSLESTVSELAYTIKAMDGIFRQIQEMEAKNIAQLEETIEEKSNVIKSLELEEKHIEGKLRALYEARRRLTACVLIVGDPGEWFTCFKESFQRLKGKWLTETVEGERRPFHLDRRPRIVLWWEGNKARIQLDVQQSQTNF